ncbi:hypothetical protein K8P10_002081 [Leucobacter sp. Psy1]|nr:hypothetical protein K8P10_002081 [Leucobacter sp. Psy1]
MKFRAIQCLAAAVIVIVAVFSIVMLNLQWLPCQEPACVIEPATQAMFGAVLFAGALVSASVLVGATMVARALSSVVGRSGTPGDSGTQRSDDDECDAAV